MEDKIIKILTEEPFVGEDGLNYIRVTKEISTPRKTYIKGTISGKYRGEKISTETDFDELYDFIIYEAEVICSSKNDVQKNRPFVFPNDFKNIKGKENIKGNIFPKEKLPPTLPVEIKSENQSFGLNILEPQLYEFESIRKLHQTEGNEVFGTFNAYVTGYVFDYEKEIVIEEIGPIIEPIVPATPLSCQSSGKKTGNTAYDGNYVSYEYFCKNHENCKIWGNKEYIEKNIKTPTSENSGCFKEVLSIIGLLLGLAFLIAIFPSLLYFIGFYIIILIIGLLIPYFKWILKILSILLLIAFISAMINSFNKNGRSYTPIPRNTDIPREITPENIPIVDSIINDSTKVVELKTDSIISRYRIWEDYQGTKYEGKYKIKLSDYKNASTFKNNLTIIQNSNKNYDAILFNLKNNDRNKLNGLYTLFDSIGKANNLKQQKFAEMIVSFVQDIPYAIILDNDCDPSLYNDPFIKNFLLKNKFACDGNQRFGINTPIEFLASLKGDCDTRTLLLYTILSHYNYDVAILSSEFYSHSVLGINMPYNGLKYKYNNQKYTLWETTAKDSKPGILSNEISNINYWRISIKSK